MLDVIKLGVVECMFVLIFELKFWFVQLKCFLSWNKLAPMECTKMVPERSACVACVVFIKYLAV